MTPTYAPAPPPPPPPRAAPRPEAPKAAPKDTTSSFVAPVEVLRGVRLLDEAAVEAVRQWVYTPTLVDGVPTPVVTTVTVNFRLADAQSL